MQAFGFEAARNIASKFSRCELPWPLLKEIVVLQGT
jgi:hypothetical protein